MTPGIPDAAQGAGHWIGGRCGLLVEARNAPLVIT